MYRRFVVIVMLFLLVLLSACQGSNNQEVPPHSEKTSVSFKPTHTFTMTPSSTTTATATGTSTPVPTSTSTSTATSTPTITPTAFLGFEDAMVYTALAYMDETLFYFIVPGVAASYYGTVDGYT
ncbi:MAG: hypothetical protein ACK2TV_06000 [Anaerolineales bacterium]